ncbi:MAG: hypothetical protein U5R48_01265 [Gammaproteobacteria bacterium]|nr:hypothetical protein [Gammaproteobacteria bacterium]
MSMRVLIGIIQSIGQPGHLHQRIQFLLQLVRGHALAPLIARLELNRGLDHGQRRRVGGGLGPSDLAERCV